ncbi:alpha/beta hydrolase [Paremcibacter congregatus]|uniref:alpha/beta hydrolase n=1 Tax=Paremcibacter congregatus TaxID=2043170 RepID=UPI0030ECDDB4|tara:strand:+ start:915 stop:2369 length:1455 start_codon:yes stop_codon:yes gene_type:complete
MTEQLSRNLIRMMSAVVSFYICLVSQGLASAPSTPCQDFEESIKGSAMECGTIQVPENHGEPEGKEITISYVVLKAKNQASTSYPMMYFSGGPGGKTLTGNSLQQWLKSPIRDERDIILFDQRGIGYSSALPNMNGEIFEILAQDVSQEAEHYLMQNVMVNVQQKIQQQGIHLENYNSFQNAADAGMIMRHLGYEKYNLYATSYGTRLARVVQDQFPEMINSVIHNSPSPMTHDFLQARLVGYSLAMERIFNFCAADKDCRENYPGLKETYFSIFRILKEKPLAVPFGEGVFVINPQDVIYLLRRASYSSRSRTLVPQLITALVDEGKGEALDQIIGFEFMIKDFMNFSMMLSVERFETFDQAHNSEYIAASYDKHPLLPVKMGLLDAFYQAGMSWHNGSVAAEDRIFKISEVPTLIMSNYFDPATPPENSHIFKERIPNALLLILDEGGHGGGNEKCRNKVMTEFMNKPKDKPDISCLVIYPE